MFTGSICSLFTKYANDNSVMISAWSYSLLHSSSSSSPTCSSSPAGDPRVSHLASGEYLWWGRCSEDLNPISDYGKLIK